MLASIDVSTRGRSDVRNTEVQGRECSTVVANLNHWDNTVMYSTVCVLDGKTLDMRVSLGRKTKERFVNGMTQSNSASSSHN